MPYITYSVRITVGIHLFVVSVVRHLRTSDGRDARLVLHAIVRRKVGQHKRSFMLGGGCWLLFVCFPEL